MPPEIKRRFLLLNKIILLVLVAGCQSADSTNIRTEAIYARMEAVAHENGETTLTVKLSVGVLSNTVIDLEGGDRLIATAGGISKDFSRDRNLFGDITYKANFNIGNAQGTEFRIAFNRATETDANNSVAYLPAPFLIDLPSSGDTFKRDDSIVVVWNPAGSGGDRMNFEAEGTCGNFTYSRSIPEPFDSAGMQTLLVSDLIPTGLAAGISCETRIILSRKQKGTLDSNFDGGYFNIKQQRAVMVNIIP